MKEFSATDAAFEGFRVARERPRAIAAWALLLLAYSLIQALATARFGGQAFVDMMAMAQQPGPRDTAKLAQIWAELAPFFAIMVPVTLITYGVLLAAANRVVLDPQNVGLGLRFGMQELRQTVVIVVLGMLQFLVYVVILTLGFILAAAAASVSQAMGGMVLALDLVLLLVALVYIGVRLSLAGPMTFDGHSVRIFQSWRLTRAHFWPMLGAYLLALIFATVVSVLGMLVLKGVYAVLGGSFAAITHPEAAKMTDVFSPANLVILVLVSILSALTWAIFALPGPVIYKQLRNGQSVR